MVKCYEDVGVKVKAKWKIVGGENIDIGAGNAFGGGEEDEKPDDQVAKVLDVVDGFRYQETTFSKKDYMTYIKAYMKKVKEYLQEKKPERVEPFTKGAQEMVKWVLSQFDEFNF
jgi:hypothetical protein